ncbi:MAG: Ig-like domain-containing protein [Gammaproteobacteria bacterium]
MTVNNINDAPSFTQGPNQTVNEDAGAQTVNAWATAISPGPSESGQTVSFQITGNTNAALFTVAPAVSVTGALSYTPAADAFGSATISVRLQDNGGTANGGVNTSAIQTFTIAVNSVNDEPSFVPGPDQHVNQDAGPQTIPNWIAFMSAGPANEASQTLSFQITGNTFPEAFSALPSVSPTGTLSYTPSPDLTNTFGDALISIVIKDNGGTANGGVDTSMVRQFRISVLPSLGAIFRDGFE